MKIVIEIDEETFKAVMSGSVLSELAINTICDAIYDGTPLPKGHGRLIDADDLWDLYHSNDFDFYEAFYDAPTIIEADKESEDKE